MALPRTFNSLRNYNFRLFWFGQFTSMIGTWMQAVGQAWLVLDLTHSPIALGTVVALQFLPILLLSLFAGVFVDRFPKRRLLLITQTTAMLQALVLAVLVSTGAIQLWHIYVLAGVLGLVNALDNPTRQSFLIEMVGREDLVNAVALHSMALNGARIIGPAIGGILIASIGLSQCFYVNAASFVAVLAGLLLMRPHLLHTPETSPKGRVLSQLSEGLRFARRTPSVFLILILIATLGTFGYNFSTVFPLLATTLLAVNADGLGMLLSMMGAGSVIGALVIAALPRATLRQLFGGAAGFTIVIAGLAISSWYPASLALMLLLGLASIAFSTAANTRLQLEVPDVLRGRVMSLYTLLFMGTTPIGGFITGFLADRWGIQWTLGIEATICAAGIVAALSYHLATGRRGTTPATSGDESY